MADAQGGPKRIDNVQNRMKCGALLALVLAWGGQIHAAEIFPLRSTWQYFVGTSEASTPTSAWRSNSFNDVTWQTGSAPVGYPSTGASGWESTSKTSARTS